MNQRGFVSAPLLGTLVFLGAIVFVVHVTQMEKTEVSGIVSDIYHNRITSMLEDYRYDMGSLFSVSLSRAIERYLTSECFLTLELKNDNFYEVGGSGGAATRGDSPAGFPKANDFNYDDFSFCDNEGKGSSTTCTEVNSPHDNPTNTGYKALCAENCNGQLDYHELRYKQCTRVSQVIRDGICPFDPRYGITAWLNATRAKYNFEGVEFAISNEEKVYNYVSSISCKFTSGQVNNPSMFQYTIGQPSCTGYSHCKFDDGVTSCSGLQGTLELGEGIKNCLQLIGDSLFDCRNFAENLAQPFRCCSEFDSNTGECKAGKEIDGCSDGTFFTDVKVLANNDVYSSLPRVNATDKGGNQLQSGALGTKDFRIHIKYPLYKYLDASFRTYLPIAYGICLPGNNNGDFESPINMKINKGKGKGKFTCNGGGNPQNGLEGIIEGLCYAPGNLCNGNCIKSGGGGCDDEDEDEKEFGGGESLGVDCTGLTDQACKAAITEAAKQKFLATFLNPDAPTSVCRLYKQPLCNTFGLCDTKLLIAGLGIESGADNKPKYQLCPKKEDDWAVIKTQLKSDQLFRQSAPGCNSVDPDSKKICTAVDGLNFKLLFVDSKAETLVNPDANKYCWYLSPVHVNPENRADPNN